MKEAIGLSLSLSPDKECSGNGYGGRNREEIEPNDNRKK